jgi:ethanolamine ammonia-lyase small subunit
MEQRRDDAKKVLNDLKSQEQDFNKLIFEKYGKVTINPENGEISKVD